ncbi:Cell division protein FtsI/penicillin-binding protein 2 [Lachnospiraceae bacterium]|nr:Cell division protein FtsI/penicillin-binding protein 2 [Lachnospiraceae bacterium]
MKEFLEREKERAEKNRIKNKPIVFMTYIMVLTFMSLFGFIIYFMFHDADRVVANARNKRQNSFDEFVSRGQIVSSDGVVLAENKTDDEGEEKRVYPYSELFAHTVGYNSYGGSGVELDCNFELMRSHANIASKVLNDLSDEKNPGDNVITTYNYELTQAAAEAMGGANGAVVVMDADTGDILVMYSSPSFDPNDMDNVWENIHSEEGSSSTVLLNRCTQGLYAPGSTFKIITALEYIREHSDYEDYSHVCYGTDIFNSVSIRCSNSTEHGELDLTESLARSCNTSFANIGTNEIDIGKLHQLAEDLLFNEKLPYDSAYNKSEFVLDKKSDISEIPQTVIGQGDTLITPLHNALIMDAIANGGVMMRPRTVKEIRSVDDAVIKKNSVKNYGQVLDPQLTQKLIPMLREVCVSGTASEYMSSKPYTVSGKTGTAEYDNNGNCNSWFVGFSEDDSPDIVVSVVVEDYTSNQISGTSVASYIMDRYYELDDNTK